MIGNFNFFTIFFVISLTCLIGLFIILRKPVFGAIIATISSAISFSLFNIGVIDFDLFKILVSITFWGFLINVLIKKDALKLPFDNQSKLLVIFFSYSFLTLLWANDFFLSLSFLFGFFINIIFYFLVLFVTRNQKDILSWYYFLPLIMLPSFIIIWNQYSALGGTLRHATSSFIRYAVYGEMIFPLALFSFIFLRKIVKVYFSILLVSAVLIIIISESRGALLFSLLNTLLFFYFLLKKSRLLGPRYVKNWGLTMGIFIAAAFVGLLVINPYTIEHFENRIIGTLYPHNVPSYYEGIYWKESVRLEVLTAGIEIFKENPLLGVGFGNYKIEFQKHASWLPEIYYVDPHNVFLRIATETGLLGLLIFLLLIFTAFRNYWFIERHLLKNGKVKDYFFVKSFEISLIGLLLHSLFRPMLFEFPFYFLIAFGLISRKLLINENRKTPLIP